MMSRDACDEWEAMTVARAVENQSQRPSIQVVVERRERRRTDNSRLFSCSPVLISQLTSTCGAVAYSTYFGFELHSCVEERESPSFKPDLNPGNSKWRKSHSLTLAEVGLFVTSCFYPISFPLYKVGYSSRSLKLPRVPGRPKLRIWVSLGLR